MYLIFFKHYRVSVKLSTQEKKTPGEAANMTKRQEYLQLHLFLSKSDIWSLSLPSSSENKNIK